MLTEAETEQRFQRQKTKSAEAETNWLRLNKQNIDNRDGTQATELERELGIQR